LKTREKECEKYFYRGPEDIDIKCEDEPLELSYDELKRVYVELIERNERKMNKNTGKMTQIVQHEKSHCAVKSEISSGLFLKSRFSSFRSFFSKNQIQT